MLIPVDGSKAALRAVDHVIGTAGLYEGRVEVHLLNVQFPILSGNVRAFVSEGKIEEYYREEGMKALQEARDRLEAAGVACHVHIGVGNVAETVLRYAKETGCDQICMARSGMGTISGILLGSVAGKLAQVSDIPVLLVG
ncbi:MAG TPA: universal stress protein [Burkholderiales bacterium]|nr:universal stress protein [Burkholderiales bacterium]